MIGKSIILGAGLALSSLLVTAGSAQAQGLVIATPEFGFAVGRGPVSLNYGAGHDYGGRYGYGRPFPPPHGAYGYRYESFGYGPGPGFGYGYGYSSRYEFGPAYGGCAPSTTIIERTIITCGRCGGRHHRGGPCRGHGPGFDHDGPGFIGHRPW
jgi:hypothetical protein